MWESREPGVQGHAQDWGLTIQWTTVISVETGTQDANQRDRRETMTSAWNRLSLSCPFRTHRDLSNSQTCKSDAPETHGTVKEAKEEARMAPEKCQGEQKGPWRLERQGHSLRR